MCALICGYLRVSLPHTNRLRRDCGNLFPNQGTLITLRGDSYLQDKQGQNRYISRNAKDCFISSNVTETAKGNAPLYSNCPQIWTLTTWNHLCSLMCRMTPNTQSYPHAGLLAHWAPLGWDLSMDKSMNWSWVLAPWGFHHFDRGVFLQACIFRFLIVIL